MDKFFAGDLAWLGGNTRDGFDSIQPHEDRCEWLSPVRASAGRDSAQLFLGAGRAGDYVVDDAFAFDAEDSDVGGVGAVGAGEVALEAGSDLGRDAGWAAHVGWVIAGALDDEAGHGPLGRVLAQRAFGAPAAAGGEQRQAGDREDNPAHALLFAIGAESLHGRPPRRGLWRFFT